jgi:FKBP-type peptidyl-prolyl cis-trans isomerase FkpA
MKNLALLLVAALFLVSSAEREDKKDITDVEILAYLAEKGWKGVKHESGLYVITDKLGEGTDRPVLTDEVTVFYAGFLLDDLKFDGTTEFPATFPLDQLIKGWQIGIPMFGKGGKGKLIMPSDLAYGDRDNGQIPGGSTLVFEIELVDFKPAK